MPYFKIGCLLFFVAFFNSLNIKEHSQKYKTEQCFMLLSLLFCINERETSKKKNRSAFYLKFCVFLIHFVKNFFSKTVTKGLDNEIGNYIETS